MKCPNCSHENNGGNFCEKCGTKLINNQNSEVAASGEVPQAQTGSVNNQTNQYLEGAKNVSKTYFKYFFDVLKKPYASAVGAGSEHFVNAIITIVLYALIIPLMIYFGLKSLIKSVDFFGIASEISLPFTDVVIKPTLAYAILILLIATFTFAVIKMGKVNPTYKEVVSRFGSFLIPFVAILLLAFIMSLLKMKLFIIVLAIGFLGSIFIVPPLVIASFKKQTQGGLDVIYGSLITYILTFIVIKLMSDLLFQALESGSLNLLNLLNY